MIIKNKPEFNITPAERLKYKAICMALFRNSYGEQYELTDGQSDIFRTVFDPRITRAVISTYTQYGKSETISLGIVATMVTRKVKILIVAPSGKQSEIIMRNVIGHFFDNPILEAMIEYEGPKAKLKQERSRRRLMTRNGSELMTLTADARNLRSQAKSLMGFGADIVIVDESSLIYDSMFIKILRMVGGVRNGKLIQLGNPWEKNHFYRAFTYDRYFKVHIDYKQGIREGRLKEEFLEEALDELSDLEFKVLYKSEFPESGKEDQLIPDNWLENAINQRCSSGKRQAGLDVARFGSDSTVYIYREGGNVKRIKAIKELDTMEVVGWVSKLLDEDEPEVCCVDVIGIGSGVYDRLEEIDEHEVEEINVGSAPSSKDNKERFVNLRAEAYWQLRKLFKPDKATGRSLISIPNDKDLIQELREIRYTYSSEKKIKIEAKDDMKRRLGRSPDKADALMLAFIDVDPEESIGFIV